MTVTITTRAVAPCVVVQKTHDKHGRLTHQVQITAAWVRVAKRSADALWITEHPAQATAEGWIKRRERCTEK